MDAVEAAYRNYEFNTVAQRLYDFVWSDFCDWFVEAAKNEIFQFAERNARPSPGASRSEPDWHRPLPQGEDRGEGDCSALIVMDYVLSAVLRLLYPFMPHMTEELWSQFGFDKGSIQFAPLPVRAELADGDLLNTRKLVSAIYQTIQAGRNLRAEARVPSNQKAKFILRANDQDLTSELPTISRLLNAEELKSDRSFQPKPGAPMAVTPLGELVLDIEVDRSAEGARLDKEIARVEQELRTAEAKLSSKSFVDRAPAAVVEEHRQRQKNFAAELAKLKQAREKL
jgi:valyl-tRNA synthetase